MKVVFKWMCAIIMVTLSLTHVHAQTGRQIWTDISADQITVSGERFTIPQTFRALRLDLAQMKNYLAQAPFEPAQTAMLQKGLLFEMPMPDGSFTRFEIFEYQVMHPDLAAKFPDIKTYTGKGIDDASATIKLDVTSFGFHAMVRSANGQVFIDPYNKNTTAYYMSYNKKDLLRLGGFECAQLL